MQIKKQVEFPLLDEFSRMFSVNEKTIFAYDDTIYTNYQLTPDLLIHEQTHLKQQEKYGLENWVVSYFTDPDFRLKVEVEAYRKQLASIKDRELRLRVRIESATNLASPLYRNIINYEEALKLLWI